MKRDVVIVIGLQCKCPGLGVEEEYVEIDIAIDTHPSSEIRIRTLRTLLIVSATDIGTGVVPFVASGTFGVRLELPNPDDAIPAGQRCRVEFNIE